VEGGIQWAGKEKGTVRGRGKLPLQNDRPDLPVALTFFCI